MKNKNKSYILVIVIVFSFFTTIISCIKEDFNPKEEIVIPNVGVTMDIYYQGYIQGAGSNFNQEDWQKDSLSFINYLK